MGDAIHIILTGGTIEKAYDPLTEKPEFKKQSIIPDYCKRIIQAYPDLTFETISQIDSVHMTEEVRSNIFNAIQNAPCQKILVIHGTLTMPDTARYLVDHLKNTDKTVILTGAMIPLKEFAMSDGGFNLGYAIASVQSASAGVYLAMNATLFGAKDVLKNTEIGRFEKR